MSRTAWILAVTLLFACSGSQPAAQTSPILRPPGALGDTWSGDGTAWHEVRVAGPKPRYSASLAYDAQHHVFVLFGGQTAQGSSDETWTWDGSKWSAMSPTHKPPARRAAAMAYDPSHQVVVLYGGLVQDNNEGVAASDTWTWNGSDWTLISAITKAPGDREGPRMVTAGNRVMLFGGRWYNVKYFGDAWTWDGKAWSRVDSNPTPPGRANAAVIWNPMDESLFVYGGTGLRSDAGIGALGKSLGDAWSLKNGAWTETKVLGLSPTANANAIWDQKTKSSVVVFGITCPQPTNAAWLFDGAAWTQGPRPVIPARWGAAVAEDPQGNVLVFGGSDEPGC